MQSGGQPEAKHSLKSIRHALLPEQGEPGDAIIRVKAAVNSGVMHSDTALGMSEFYHRRGMQFIH